MEDRVPMQDTSSEEMIEYNRPDFVDLVLVETPRGMELAEAPRWSGIKAGNVVELNSGRVLVLNVAVIIETSGNVCEMMYELLSQPKVQPVLGKWKYEKLRWN